MLVRRRILLASLVCSGVLALRGTLAQSRFMPDQDGDTDWRHPNPGRPGPALDDSLDGDMEDQPHPGPHKPPPRLELRPPPPDQGVWHWQAGHWVRAGESWRWIGGKWDH